MASPPSAGENRPRGRGAGMGGASVKLALPVALALGALALLAVVLLTSPSGNARRVATSQRPRPAAQQPPERGPLPSCGASCDPIDARYLTDVPFGRTSFWVQPWRAYLDTWPASRLRDALGINFNVGGARAIAVARLLHDSGFRLARMEIGWDALSYAQPTHFVHEASILARMRALHAYRLRPLLVLNANSGGPCPARAIELETSTAAAAGSMTVTLTPSSAALVHAGRTGFSPGSFFAAPRRHRRRVIPRLTPAEHRARRAAARAKRRIALAEGRTPLLLHANPDILITRVSANGVATLSHPLPVALAPGPHPAVTLLYAPFSAPRLPSGAPSPAYATTLRGWLSYVASVSALARRVFGPDGYDLEVWNELTFGSQFLNVENYYRVSGHAARSAGKHVTKEVNHALLDATVAFLRSPRSGTSRGVGITNGFASETPFPSGADAPSGLTALSKHPYVGVRSFPAEYHVRSVHPVNALGLRDTASRASFKPSFVPSYQSLLPEYVLTATSTETLIRDLAPITTKVYGLPHGRAVGPHGAPVQKWVTEYNLGAGATPVGPDETTLETSVALSESDKAHFHAKALLRSLVAMVSKGITREYFFAAAPGALSLIGGGFFGALERRPGRYPGDASAGPVMSAFSRLIGHMQGPGPGASTRRLALRSITQLGRHAQFAGDGTAAHPPLYDREVLAVFPFQTGPRRFVVPVYVMTRDLLTLYRPHAPASDTTRFDLPGEQFDITLAGLPSSSAAPTVSAYDPLSDTSTPARVLAHHPGSAVVRMTATDYPRLLSIALP